MTGHSLVNSPIVLTTDFGTSDAFVGVMKGVILGINPHASIVDLTHEIAPQNVRQGAFVLGANHSYFPTGAIHVAVVDPGVGTDRRPIVLETPRAKFIAPDNGLLSEIIRANLPPQRPEFASSGRVILPAEIRAFELTNPRYRLPDVSSTFHGRDIFSPAAAHLSLGVLCKEMGPRLRDLVYEPLPEPDLRDHVLYGEVIYIDRFGNLITNVEVSALSQERLSRQPPRVQVEDREIGGISRTFHDPVSGDLAQPDGLPLVALFGSNGFLEIAVTDGNASASLGAGVGTKVRVIFNP